MKSINNKAHPFFIYFVINRKFAVAGISNDTLMSFEHLCRWILAIAHDYFFQMVLNMTKYYKS